MDCKNIKAHKSDSLDPESTVFKVVQFTVFTNTHAFAF